MMRVKAVFLLLAVLFSLNAYSQINIPLLHQLVEDSKNEHKKQSEAKENQAKNAINEEVNKNMLNQVKNKYKVVQQRFAKLTIAFDAVGIAVSATPLVRSIIDNQQQIIYYCQMEPTLIPFALETERVFATKSHSLMNYLIGLSASIGELNQMKVSERRILFQHILNELRDINQLSWSASRTLSSYLQRTRGSNPYVDYVKDELRLVDEIMANIKTLEN